MFGVDSTELLIIALAALIFIGPKELPTAMRTVGRWVGQARGHARHFTAGIENMMREAELEEMEKRWREENDRIMREHPVAAPYPGAPDSAGGSPASLATGGEGWTIHAPDPSAPLVAAEGGTPTQSVPGEVEARLPPAASLTDEPGLPLPEPEHHRRELP
jgi:sec-independent protein translocase protein TatB